MFSTVWECLSPEARDCVTAFARSRPYMRHWEYNEQAYKKQAEQGHIAAIMRATPADVKHNRGVFND